MEEISVSLDVFEGDYVNNQHNFNLEKNIAQAPGIHIIDGQVNIRGGSGWAMAQDQEFGFTRWTSCCKLYHWCSTMGINSC